MNASLQTAFPKEHLAKLLATPFRQLTPGQMILRILLKVNPDILKNLQFHEKVNYWWVQIHSSVFGEIVLCFWLPKSWSERHDHYYTWNLSIVLLNKLLARKYRVSSSKFFTFHKAEVGEMGITTTLPWQVHSLANPFDELCISINFYALRRPSVSLVVED